MFKYEESNMIGTCHIEKKMNAKKSLLIALLFVMIGIYGCAGDSNEDGYVDIRDNIGVSENDTWENYLYTPTQIVKELDLYFIEDCWNGRILCSPVLSSDLANWKVLSDGIKGGHTIASDGHRLLIDDSENNSVLVYEYDPISETFIKTQSIRIDGRPHYVYFDSAYNNFMVLSSESGTITILDVDEADRICVRERHSLDNININYTRSFSIIDGHMYITTGEGIIYEVDYRNDWTVLNSYTVDDEVANMNYLTKINDYYYLTSYMGKNAVYDTDYNSKFIRAKSIEDICAGNYEELNEKFNFSGTPYFISYFDEKYYITEIDGENGIYSFEVEGDKIKVSAQTWVP